MNDDLTSSFKFLIEAVVREAIRKELPIIIKEEFKHAMESKNSEGSNDLFSIGSAAKKLGVSRPKLDNLINAGRIKTVKLGTQKKIASKEIERVLCQGC